MRIAAPLEDLLALQGCENYCVPDFSTLCRRAKQLEVLFSQTLKYKKALHVLVDSTGIKVISKKKFSFLKIKGESSFSNQIFYTQLQFMVSKKYEQTAPSFGAIPSNPKL